MIVIAVQESTYKKAKLSSPSLSRGDTGIPLDYDDEDDEDSDGELGDLDAVGAAAGAGQSAPSDALQPAQEVRRKRRHKGDSTNADSAKASSDEQAKAVSERQTVAVGLGRRSTEPRPSLAGRPGSQAPAANPVAHARAGTQVNHKSPLLGKILEHLGSDWSVVECVMLGQIGLLVVLRGEHIEHVSDVEWDTEATGGPTRNLPNKVRQGRCIDDALSE